MTMLTVEQFEALEVGDLIETSPVFCALSDETVVLHTVVRDEKTDRLEFVVTYFGVTLGRWACTRKNGELVWETE
ncbi:MAG: hypothetical protein KJZ83_00405 [Burkholderiaceae bacterium]|nr:hypothetical protein [Burkholderiaceae bacterium]